MRFFQALCAALAAEFAVLIVSPDAFWKAWIVAMLVYLAVNPPRFLWSDK